MRSAFLILASGFIMASVPLASNAHAADGVALRTATLRAGPDTSYPAVASVSSGDDLQIYGCLSGYTWCDVSADGERGWLRGSRIDFLRGGTRLSISDGYADFGLPIAVFSLNDYWGTYYGDQSWFSNRRWRRGNNALPSNWQQNRSAWVHPGTQTARPAQTATPNGVQHAAPRPSGPIRQVVTRAAPKSPPNTVAHSRVTPSGVSAHAPTATTPHRQAVTHSQRAPQHVQQSHAAPRPAAPRAAAPVIEPPKR
jgi:uncharacterized protein YraI